jgi:hypothetical protein
MKSAPGEAQALPDLLRIHGRADDLNALAADKKRLKASEREAIEAIQDIAMKAAARIAELEAEVRRRYSEDEIAAACAALEIWDAKYESLLITLQEKRDAAHQETPNA